MNLKCSYKTWRSVGHFDIVPFCGLCFLFILISLKDLTAYLNTHSHIYMNSVHINALSDLVSMYILWCQQARSPISLELISQLVQYRTNTKMIVRSNVSHSMKPGFRECSKTSVIFIAVCRFTLQWMDKSLQSGGTLLSVLPSHMKALYYL